MQTTFLHNFQPRPNSAIIIWFDKVLQVHNNPAYEAVKNFHGTVLPVVSLDYDQDSWFGHDTVTTNQSVHYPAKARKQALDDLAKELSTEGHTLLAMPGLTCDFILQVAAFSGATQVLTDPESDPTKQRIIDILQQQGIETITPRYNLLSA